MPKNHNINGADKSPPPAETSGNKKNYVEIDEEDGVDIGDIEESDDGEKNKQNEG
jgi:hypothetical protein